MLSQASLFLIYQEIEKDLKIHLKPMAMGFSYTSPTPRLQIHAVNSIFPSISTTNQAKPTNNVLKKNINCFQCFEIAEMHYTLFIKVKLRELLNSGLIAHLFVYRWLKSKVLSLILDAAEFFNRAFCASLFFPKHNCYHNNMILCTS